MLVSDLIRQSYFTAHVLREGEETTGFRAVQGLQLLNELLDDWGSLGVYIPYTKINTITTESNVYQYVTTPPVAAIDEAHIIINTNVQYKLQAATEYDFNLMNFSQPLTRPSMYYLSTEQVFNEVGELGSKIYLWPTPDQAYVTKFIVRETLQDVLLFDDLTALPPRVYKTLRYQLAGDIQALYGTELPEKFYMDLRELVAKMQAMNPTDNAVQTMDPLHTQRRFKPWGYGAGVGGTF